MEPLKATQEAVDEYGPFSYRGGDLLHRLGALAEQVELQVPTCVGLSLSLEETGATFTLVASNKQVAVLDAVQYINGGPCVDAVHEGHTVAFRPAEKGDAPREARGGDDVDRRWPLFVKATTTVGVRSTLSLPIVHDGEVTGGFNLYASTVNAFDDHHDSLGDLLGAWSGGAVTDADLGFFTREVAERAPAVLRVATRIMVAASLLEASDILARDEGEQRLRDAAIRAGVPLGSVVDLVIELLGSAPHLDPWT